MRHISIDTCDSSSIRRLTIGLGRVLVATLLITSIGVARDQCSGESQPFSCRDAGRLSTRPTYAKYCQGTISLLQSSCHEPAGQSVESGVHTTSMCAKRINTVYYIAIEYSAHPLLGPKSFWMAVALPEIPGCVLPKQIPPSPSGSPWLQFRLRSAPACSTSHTMPALDRSRVFVRSAYVGGDNPSARRGISTWGIS
ncbi:hypothetical protein BO78DRAFT_187584 [Aspergillus sclerotiicarbonarius CBS 121057]|uniref:Uncharacterized protein n=1 Tax=Aspergillus sclerotiicarbonarius (strain CBS 121057 / IBT 28362) TaxID=1448318 RepID=A0A319EB31_ASPSB|nr:hypothetical protein BO78DRAFT_187584 [Aspergillus sclerotiicarbonarius CBS 121057]